MFSQALTHIVTRLDQAQRARLLASYALIGGFAVSAWGVARATQDIDLAVALGTSNPQTLADNLGATYEAGGLDDPLRGVFRLSIRGTGHDVPVQLIMLPSAFAALAFENIERLTIGECSVPVVNWKALVLLKLFAGGPVDLQDARHIVSVCKPNERDRHELLTRGNSLGLGQEVRALLDAAI